MDFYTDYSDLLTYQIPQMRYLVSSWQQTGEQPLWCPYSFAGMPFIHDLQVGAFYPPHLLLDHLPEATIGPALSWLVIAHVIIAGWAMYAYARCQGLNRTCAMVAVPGLHVFRQMAAASPGGGAICRSWSGVAPPGAPASRTVRESRGPLLRLLGRAALALVILGSHPQFTFYAGVLILVWTLPLALEQAGALGPGVRTWRKIVVGLGRWLAAVGWCCLVAPGRDCGSAFAHSGSSQTDDPCC